MHGPKQYAMTLQDVSDCLANGASIKPQKRREQRSAISTFAKACGRTPSEIIADAPHINYLLEHAAWQRLGITKRSWANVQSRLRTAMQEAGFDIVKRRNFKLTPEWEDFLAPLSRRGRQDLSRFAGFCVLMGIKPLSVDADTFARFQQFCDEQIIQCGSREKWQAARRAWNRLAAQTAGLPIIPNNRSIRWRGLAFDALPEGLRQDLVALRQWLTTDGDGNDERDAIKPVTAFHYVSNLRRYVSHLVEMGVPPDQLGSLTSILEGKLVASFFDALAAKRGSTREILKSRGDTYLHAYVAALMAAARFVHAPAELWSVLARLGKLATVKQWGMSDKNWDRVNTLCAPDVEPKYLNLPYTIAKRLQDVKTPSIEQALAMQSAAALEFMIRAPLRIENVAKLDLEKHIRRPGARQQGNWLVHFEGHEVKNGKQIDAELKGPTSALLDRYLTVFRPVLLRKGPSSAFFLSMNGEPKSKEALARQLKKLIKRELGIDWNPHIVRPYAGTITLEEKPGSFRVVQDLLGHRKSETTENYYLRRNAQASFREYDEIVERRRQKASEDRSAGNRKPRK